MNEAIITPPPRLEPVLKWAGGKRWLANRYAAFLPEASERYIEPFAGSAAVFFYCRPRKAILSDSNAQLISMYQALKEDWGRVHFHLQRHRRNHSNSYYYQVRRARPRNIYTRAARFIYLNRTCWNGLYRVNQQGEFNVPRGTKSSVILDSDDFSSVAQLLQNADLRCSDFEAIIDEAGKGDFVFADPPYTVRHNLNGFVKYNEKLFSWDDQRRLKEAVLRAKHRGATLLMTNANHESIIALYSSSFEIKTVQRFSAISSKATTRATFDELIIT